MGQSAERVDVLIASYLEDALVERIRAARDDIHVHYRPDLLPPPRFAADHTGGPFQRGADDEATWQELLRSATVLFDFDYLRPSNLLEHAPRLRWVQATSSGIGGFLRHTGLDATDITFTTAAGIHGRPLAEFVLWATLSIAKNYLQARSQQRTETWRRFHGGELLGSTLLMVGMGGIGRAVAGMLRPFGVRVLGVKRDTDGVDPDSLGVDAIVPWRELDRVLPEADHVVLACPLTPETEGLFGAARLALCKPGSSLINVGRGGLVDSEALLEALDRGQLAGAVLDVTDPEPLPAGHPLWQHERVIVFPHSASTSVCENARLTDLFCDNLNRFMEGRALRNVYERGRGY